MIEIVRAHSQMSHSLAILFNVSEGQRNERLFVRNHIALQCFRGPCKSNACAHHVKPLTFHLLEKTEYATRIGDPKHGPCCKNWLMIVRDLTILEFVLVCELLS